MSAQIHYVHRIEEMTQYHGNIIQLLLQVGTNHEDDMSHFWIDCVQHHDDYLVVANLISLPFVARVVDGSVGRA